MQETNFQTAFSEYFVSWSKKKLQPCSVPWEIWTLIRMNLVNFLFFSLKIGFLWRIRYSNFFHQSTFFSFFKKLTLSEKRGKRRRWRSLFLTHTSWWCLLFDVSRAVEWWRRMSSGLDEKLAPSLSALYFDHAHWAGDFSISDILG